MGDELFITLQGQLRIVVLKQKYVKDILRFSLMAYNTAPRRSPPEVPWSA